MKASLDWIEISYPRGPSEPARSCPVPSAIQKFSPSLQAPNGSVPTPVETDPSEARSAAFQRTTVAGGLVRDEDPLAVEGRRQRRVQSRCRSASAGRLRWRRGRPSRRSIRKLGTQMFAFRRTPDRTASVPTVTVWRTAPAESSSRSVPALLSVTQMLDPSNTGAAELERTRRDRRDAPGNRRAGRHDRDGSRERRGWRSRRGLRRTRSRRRPSQVARDDRDDPGREPRIERVEAAGVGRADGDDQAHGGQDAPGLVGPGPRLQ